MDKKHLLKTANKLNAVNSKTAKEYDAKSSELISKMNEFMLNRPDIKDLVGENNIDMMKDNHANHIRFISSIMKNYNANIMVDTVLWVFNAYQNHGFASNYWAAQLNTWIELMKATFSEATFKEVYPFYEWMQVNIPVFVSVSKNIDLTEEPKHS